MRTNYSNPMINKALDALEIMSADSVTRDLAERREKALKDETMAGAYCISSMAIRYYP